MAHEITELAPGIHSFASAREHAWHGLGTVLDHTMTAEEALEAAHLDGWNVRKVPMTFSDVTEHGVTTGEVPDRFAIVYTNPVTRGVTVTGVAGTHFEPIQNEATTKILDIITDESGAHFETAGALRGGKDVFVSMKLPEAMLIGGQDAIDLYLIAINSHDGNSAFRLNVTPVRPVCANTVAAGLRNSRSSFKVRHNAGSEQRAILEARKALDLTFKYAGEFQEEADRMIEQALADSEFEQITARLFAGGDAASARAKKIAEEHVAGVMSLWRDDPFETLGATKGTRWGGFQAVTEYTDHVMKVRSGQPTAARALRSATSMTMHTLKTDAFRALAVAR